jgi:hypothetical protein
MEVQSQPHEPVGLPTGKERMVVTEYQGGWHLASFWKLRRKEKLSHLPEIELQFLGHPARSLINVPTELPGLGVKEMVGIYLTVSYLAPSCTQTDPVSS